MIENDLKQPIIYNTHDKEDIFMTNFPNRENQELPPDNIYEFLISRQQILPTHQIHHN